MAEDYINPKEISEEMLALYGIWKILKYIKTGTDVILHIKDGSKVAGRKEEFSETTGILKISSQLGVPVESKLEGAKPIIEKYTVIWHYHITQIYGIGLIKDDPSKQSMPKTEKN